MNDQEPTPEQQQKMDEFVQTLQATRAWVRANQPGAHMSDYSLTARILMLVFLVGMAAIVIAVSTALLVWLL